MKDILINSCSLLSSQYTCLPRALISKLYQRKNFPYLHEHRAVPCSRRMDSVQLIPYCDAFSTGPLIVHSYIFYTYVNLFIVCRLGMKIPGGNLIKTIVSYNFVCLPTSTLLVIRDFVCRSISLAFIPFRAWNSCVSRGNPDFSHFRLCPASRGNIWWSP